MKKNIRVFALMLAMVLLMSSLATLFCTGSVGAATKKTTATTKAKVEGKIYYSYEWKVLSYVNKERAKHGLSKLKMSKGLNKVANRRAAELSLRYEHKRPNGQRGIDIYPWRYEVCENLAINQKTAKKVFTDWMKSFAHRKGILNKKYKSVGIGCFYTNNNFYWVQYFVDNRIKKNCAKLNDRKATYTIDILKDNVDAYQKRTEINLEETGEKVALTLYQHTSTIENYDFITPIKADCVVFETDNDAVVDVDQKGNVISKACGEANIIAYLKGAEDKKVIWSVRVALPECGECEEMCRVA